MRYGLSLQTAPSGEPLTTAEAKKQCEVATAITAHDTFLDSLVAAARQDFERITGRVLLTQTWDLYLDRFPLGSDPILLPKPPLISVTSVVYTDTAGASQTMTASDYLVSTGREPAKIALAFGASWPVARAQQDAVRVRFQCGYGAASAVPAMIKAGLLLLVGHWFTKREATVEGTIVNERPLAVQRIWDAFRFGDEFDEYAPREAATC